MSLPQPSLLSPRSRRLGARASVAMAVLLIAAAASAATLPPGFSETAVGVGLVNATAMTIAPDGRIFVCQQGGQLRVIKNGALLVQPFVTISVNSAGERGLLGVAFDPQFATNRFVYVYYTTSAAPIHNRVSRFTASATNPDVATAGSEVQIFNLPNLSSATNHNGGAIHFGPDGQLYIAVGENANSANAPLLTTTLGKMLRINKDGTIPTNNPFFGQTTGNNRAIWARGLRNPFTFAFQPGTGRIHINDVGQNTWEEVNQGVAGSNYGWPATEGPEPPGQVGVRYPIHFYSHAGGTCAIVGAAFYNPGIQHFPPEFVGRYFFGDLCAGFIRVLHPPNYTQATGFATGINTLVDLAVGADGALYYLSRGAGAVFRVAFTQNAAPAITQHPQDRTVAVGQPASFTVAASGVEPLSYQWQRGGVDIAGATSTTFTLASATADDDGAMFRAIVENEFGSATSNSATLTVTANTPPVATITAPAHNTFYRGGDTFTFSGTGTDAEDGTLPASAFTWRVDFHHDTHTHPFVPPTSGVRSGSFTIPTRGETAANVFYRVILTVRDSGGLTHTVSVDLVPRTSTITLATQPTGLQLTLDGQPVIAPTSVVGVVGIIRALGAVSPQTAGGITYTFASWSDGGAATHEISTPSVNTTFTATYQAVPVPNFSLSATPPTLGVDRGASGTSTIGITRINGFTSSVAFSASGLPSGVTVAFAPPSTTANSSVATFTASAAATLGTASVTIIGTGGGLTRTTTVALTVNLGGTGGVTATPVISSNTPFFVDEAVRLSNTAPLTALSITIVIQRTPGISFSGQYNTAGDQTIQSNSSTATAITYQFTLVTGLTLRPGLNRLFGAQASGTGTVHPTSGDTWRVTYTTGGTTFTQSGTF